MYYKYIEGFLCVFVIIIIIIRHYSGDEKEWEDAIMFTI